MATLSPSQPVITILERLSSTNITALAFSKDNRYLAIITDQMFLDIYDLETCEMTAYRRARSYEKYVSLAWYRKWNQNHVYIGMAEGNLQSFRDDNLNWTNMAAARPENPLVAIDCDKTAVYTTDVHGNIYMKEHLDNRWQTVREHEWNIKNFVKDISVSEDGSLIILHTRSGIMQVTKSGKPKRLVIDDMLGPPLLTFKEDGTPHTISGVMQNEVVRKWAYRGVLIQSRGSRPRKLAGQLIHDDIVIALETSRQKKDEPVRVVLEEAFTSEREFDPMSFFKMNISRTPDENIPIAVSPNKQYIAIGSGLHEHETGILTHPDKPHLFVLNFNWPMLGTDHSPRATPLEKLFSC